MDLNFRKPIHILAFLMLLISFFVILIMPILLFFDIISFQDPEFVQNIDYFNEIFLLIFQLILALVLFILIPIFWYLLVNNTTLKQSLYKMRIRLENIDIAFLYGILATIAMYALSFILVAVLEFSGANIQDISNIQDIELYFSPIPMFILIAIMPVAEEIFFRGFLLDKINNYAGKNITIFSTAILFGIAHMEYAKIYPVVLTFLMGIILAYIVFKTKNLFSAIIAHVTYNVIVYVMYILASSLN
ncbi:MAG: CPBP family intramembrane metalloprotease [Thermoplasmatales archaeon]|nr:MAG: CPBP family intramembrane metalloprotease [Thermoplasmatales archaeon]